MIFDTVSSVLIRTTGFTALAAVLAIWVLQASRSPRVHRVVWLFVILQGWIFGSLSIAVPEHAAWTTKVVESIAPDSLSNGIATHVKSSAIRANATRQSVEWQSSFVGVWGFGVLVSLCVAARGYWTTAVNIPLGRGLRHAAWQREWEDAQAACPVKAPVALRTSSDVGPLCCFVPFIYIVLVPRKVWSRLNSQQRIAILRHELAHVARGDLWKSVIVRLLAIPQWFNPLVWLAVHRFDEAAEWACDEMAAPPETDCRQHELAAALIAIAETKLRSFTGTANAKGSGLRTRIHRLLTTNKVEDSRMKKLGTLLLFSVLTAVHLVDVESVAADAATSGAAQVSENGGGTEGQEIERKADLARTGLVPYRVGPPDVLYITAESESHRIDAELLVGADGKVNLGQLGLLSVNEKTLNEIEAEIQQKLANATACEVKLRQRNSKCFYVVSKGERDSVVRIPCSAHSTIADAVPNASLPRDVDFTKVAIEVHRNVADKLRVIPINWDDKGKKFKLLPADRIMVTDSRLAVAAFVPPLVAPTDGKVRLNIRIISDPQGNLFEFEQLRTQTMMLSNADVTLGALDILERNNLINTLAAPAVICRSGGEAQIETDNPLDREMLPKISGVKIQAKPIIEGERIVNVSTVVSLKRPGADVGVESAARIGPGMTVIQRVYPIAHADEEPGQVTPCVYLVVTPEIE